MGKDFALFGTYYNVRSVDMTKNELYYELIEKFGAENQILKCIEELNELGQALCKITSRENSKIKATRNVIEEIADVEIMLEQIKLILDIDEKEVKRMKSFKLHRTAKKYGFERGNV